MEIISGMRRISLDAALIKRRIYEQALERWQYTLERNKMSDHDYAVTSALIDTLLTDLDRTQDEIRHIISGEDD